MRLLPTLALVVSLVACAKPRPAGFTGNEVLAFGVSHFKGSYRFKVYADGRAVHTSSKGHGGADETVVEATVTPEELRQVAKVLREASFCSLSSSDRRGVPDEARPSIAIRFEDLDCRVQMWDGDFRDDAKAKASLAAVEDLGRAIAARAH